MRWSEAGVEGRAMIEVRTILAPTDFSQHAEGAVRYAC
jgi:hypothetical protein